MAHRNNRHARVGATRHIAGVPEVDTGLIGENEHQIGRRILDTSLDVLGALYAYAVNRDTDVTQSRIHCGCIVVALREHEHRYTVGCAQISLQVLPNASFETRGDHRL